jgi:glycosyltransferase involved in cell wall biosynthesis
MSLSGEDIICLALRGWNSPWKNNQQVMSVLARSNRVLYVQPPRSLRAALRERAEGDREAKYIYWRTSGLAVYTEPWFLSRVRETRPGAVVMNRATAAARAVHVRGIARRLGFATPILWVYDPMAAPQVGMFGEKLIVFHVIDNYNEYYSSARAKALVSMRQEALLKRADVVFTVSEALQERCRRVNPNSHWVPNGVNYQLFQDATRAKQVPADMARIARPVIGYVGSMQPRIDMALLREIADRRPGWSLVIVGPLEYLDEASGLSILTARPNIHYLGPKPIELVPLYMLSCDVCLIPYKIDGFAAYSDNLKLYEYLACGRPVVSSDMPSSRRFAPLVSIARGAEGFIQAIEALLAAGNSEADAEARMAAASQHSWDRRVEAMRELIEAALTTARPTVTTISE